MGPFYGFFGAGLALYFASQGAGRILWQTIAAVLRVILAAGGGWLAAQFSAGTAGVFAALAAALVLYGTMNAVSIATGVWFRGLKQEDKETLPLSIAVKEGAR